MRRIENIRMPKTFLVVLDSLPALPARPSRQAIKRRPADEVRLLFESFYRTARVCPKTT